jgi:hypothetical protein
MTKPCPDGETAAGDGWYRRRFGRRIESGVNRLIGLLLGAIGLYALDLTLSAEGFSLARHWPGVVIGATLLLLSFLCFWARRSIIAGFGDDTDVLPVQRRSK